MILEHIETGNKIFYENESKIPSNFIIEKIKSNYYSYYEEGRLKINSLDENENEEVIITETIQTANNQIGIGYSQVNIKEDIKEKINIFKKVYNYFKELSK